MTLIVFIIWIMMNSVLLNLALKIGWDFDPGFVGPFLIVMMLNFTVALYGSSNRKNTQE